MALFFLDIPIDRYSSGSGLEAALKDKAFIPNELGSIVKQFHGDGKYHFYLIKDLHCDFQAQKNIGQIIKLLFRRYDISFVALEGASGLLDTRPLSILPDPSMRDAVLENLLAEGFLTGAEWVAAREKIYGDFWGAEDKKLYFDNLDVFISTQDHEKEAQSLLASLRMGLQKEKLRRLPIQLYRLDKTFWEYRDGKPNLELLLKRLNHETKRQEILLPDILQQCLKMFQISKRVDADHLNRDIQEITEAISQKLSKNDLKDFLRRVMLYRLGKISESSFLSELKNLADKAGILLGPFRHFRLHQQRLRIESKLALDDINTALEDSVRQIFSGENKTWYADTLKWYQMRDFVSLKLSGKDWEEIKDQDLNQYFASLISMYQKPELNPEETTHFRNWLMKAQSFYETADKRSEELTASTLSRLKERKGSNVILIAGGFHTEGLENELQKRSISYTVILPKTDLSKTNFYKERLLLKPSGLDFLLSDSNKTNISLSHSTDTFLAPPLRTAAKPLYPWLRPLILKKAFLFYALLGFFRTGKALSKEDFLKMKERLKDSVSDGDRGQLEAFLDTMALSRDPIRSKGQIWLRGRVEGKEWLIVLGKDFDSDNRGFPGKLIAEGKLDEGNKISFKVFSPEGGLSNVLWKWMQIKDWMIKGWINLGFFLSRHFNFADTVFQYLSKGRLSTGAGLIDNDFFKDELLWWMIHAKDERLSKLSEQMYLSILKTSSNTQGLKEVSTAQLAHMIDHTLLGPGISVQQIDRIVQEASDNQFGLVMLMPLDVPIAAEGLRKRNEKNVKIGAVVGFPLSGLTETKLLETEYAIHQGATEIDMVIDHASLVRGNDEAVLKDIQAVVERAKTVGGPEILVKVIIETGILTEDEKMRAIRIVKDSGADCVKTSTGFYGGATSPDVALMRLISGPEFMVKASGGIRNLKDAIEMIESGADRLGTSRGVNVMKETSGLNNLSITPLKPEILLEKIRTLREEYLKRGNKLSIRTEGYDATLGKEESEEALESISSPEFQSLQRNDLVSRINLVNLRPKLSTQDLEDMAQIVTENGFRAAIVAPVYVSELIAIFRRKGIDRPVIAAVGFPFNTITEAKIFETEQALLSGADGIKTVMDVAAVRRGESDKVLGDLQRVVEKAREVSHGKARVDVILDAALLKEGLSEDETERLIREAAGIVLRSGADGVSLNTGWKGKAEAQDIRIVREVVGKDFRVTASGGVKTLSKALEMIQAGATYVSSSDALAILRQFDLLKPPKREISSSKGRSPLLSVQDFVFKNQTMMIIAAISVLVDRSTKYWITQWIPTVEQLEEGGFRNFPHPQNIPIPMYPVFGDFVYLTRVIHYISIVEGFLRFAMASAFVGLYFKFAKNLTPWVKIGLGLMLGGFLGNIWDILFNDGVLDWLNIGYLQGIALNLADLSAFFGAIILALHVDDRFQIARATRKMRKEAGDSRLPETLRSKISNVYFDYQLGGLRDESRVKFLRRVFDAKNFPEEHAFFEQMARRYRSKFVFSRLLRKGLSIQDKIEIIQDLAKRKEKLSAEAYRNLVFSLYNVLFGIPVQTVGTPDEFHLDRVSNLSKKYEDFLLILNQIVLLNDRQCESHLKDIFESASNQDLIVQALGTLKRKKIFRQLTNQQILGIFRLIFSVNPQHLTGILADPDFQALFQGAKLENELLLPPQFSFFDEAA